MSTADVAQTFRSLSGPVSMTRVTRSPSLPLVILFLMLLTSYVYTPPRWQDWNQNSRFDLTRAIVEQGTVRIDDYYENTGDYAIYDGHMYTDKAPGLSLLAVPAYAATELAQSLGLSELTARLGESEGFAETLNPDGQGVNQERINTAVALYLATVTTVAIPAALMGVLIALIVQRTTGCRMSGILAALVIGLATPVFTYSQAFIGHIPAAVCIIGALALIALRPDDQLGNRRLFSVGLLLGTAVLIEYPAALVGLPVALWAAWLSRGRAILYGTLGAVPPLAVLGIYDLIAFGTVIPVGYEHSALWQEQHQSGFLSLTYPHWDAIWGLTGSTFRGLFFYSPVLLAVLPGAWLGLRNRRQRIPVVLAMIAFIALFLVIASSVMWWGGFAVGPRYLVPAIPMLAIPLGVVIARFNAAGLTVRAAGLSVVGLVSLISAAFIWSTTFARQNYPPDSIRNPLADYVWPAMQDGDVARNLGMVLQVDGLASLIPLLVLMGVALMMLGSSLLRLQRVAP